MSLGLLAIASAKRASIAVLFGFWALACATPSVAQGTSKVARVGILSPEENDHTPAFVAFREGMRDLGYEEGQSIVLDFRLAKGHNESLGQLATELVHIPVDVIVAGGITAIRAAWSGLGIGVARPLGGRGGLCNPASRSGGRR